MFKVHLGDTPHNLEAKDYEELGVATEGFSGSDVAVVVKDVLMEPVRLTQDAGFFRYAANMSYCCLPKACHAKSSSGMCKLPVKIYLPHLPPGRLSAVSLGFQQHFVC